VGKAQVNSGISTQGKLIAHMYVSIFDEEVVGLVVAAAALALITVDTQHFLG
jgi:hypothetical protein